MLLRKSTLGKRWERSASKAWVKATKHLMVYPVSIVLDGDCLVLLRDRQPLHIVLFDEFKEGLVAEHLCDFELMLVPALGEAGLNIALTHVERSPVDVRAGFADEDAKGDIEVRALLLATLNAVSVVGVLNELFLDKLSLLLGLTLNHRLNLRRLNIDQVRVVRQVLIRLLLGAGHPGRLEPLG